MPEGRFAEVVILGEDRSHASFTRRWLLQHLSTQPSSVRVRLPAGGSGKQFVLREFPKEVALYRRNAAKRSLLLVAMIDADKNEFLDDYASLTGQVTGEPGVFVFVPKRNIETWIHHLNGQPANENDSYKLVYKDDSKRAIRIASEKFLELVGSPPAGNLLPSLAHGVQEARRIPRQHHPIQ